MRPLFFLLIFLSANSCFANMASPIQRGTHTGSAFSSRDISILKENIFIKPAADFKTAAFKIEYFINCDSAGKQIPLLFLARDYKGEFKVWVDGIEIKIMDIPSSYLDDNKSAFNKFSNAFSASTMQGEPACVSIYWEERVANIYRLTDLKYFETSLTKGAHIIRVEYIANVWTDHSGWVKEYSFRYSLSPARYWKSFGTLQVVLDASKAGNQLTSNLGAPTKGKTDAVASWSFNKLPADYFNITYRPALSSLSQSLIKIGPEGLTVAWAIILAALHIVAIKRYRKKNVAVKYSWVVIAGSIIVPFVILLGYIFSFYLIDNSIGVEAGRRHGYTFLVMVLYPVLLAVYWVIMWLIDRSIKRKSIV